MFCCGIEIVVIFRSVGIWKSMLECVFMEITELDCQLPSLRDRPSETNGMLWLEIM